MKKMKRVLRHQHLRTEVKHRRIGTTLKSEFSITKNNNSVLDVQLLVHDGMNAASN